jgi:predicted small secreted protein
MTTRAKRSRVAALLLLPIGLSLSALTAGCNTARGMGEDVQAVGSAVSGGAQATENKMEETAKEATK